MAGTSCWRPVFLRFLSGVCVDSFGVGLRLALQALYLICHDVKLSVKTKPRPFVCLFVCLLQVNLLPAAQNSVSI